MENRRSPRRRGRIGRRDECSDLVERIAGTTGGTEPRAHGVSLVFDGAFPTGQAADILPVWIEDRFDRFRREACAAVRTEPIATARPDMFPHGPAAVETGHRLDRARRRVPIRRMTAGALLGVDPRPAEPGKGRAAGLDTMSLGIDAMPLARPFGACFLDVVAHVSSGPWSGVTGAIASAVQPDSRGKASCARQRSYTVRPSSVMAKGSMI